MKLINKVMIAVVVTSIVVSINAYSEDEKININNVTRSLVWCGIGGVFHLVYKAERDIFVNAVARVAMLGSGAIAAGFMISGVDELRALRRLEKHRNKDKDDNFINNVDSVTKGCCLAGLGYGIHKTHKVYGPHKPIIKPLVGTVALACGAASAGYVISGIGELDHLKRQERQRFATDYFRYLEKHYGK